MIRGIEQGHRPALLRRLAIASLLALVGTFASVERAEAAPNMEIAVQDDPLYAGGNYFGRAKGIQRARQLGATRIRVNLSWTSVLSRRQVRSRKVPRNLRYDFSQYDGIVAATQNTPIRVQFALVGPAPRWAAGNKKIGPYKPNPRHFRNFAAAAARQYPQVDRWSIWNEPNHVGWLAPANSGRHYRKMYVAGYNAIKRANPRAQVLIAETSPYRIRRSNGRTTAAAPLAFLRQMTCANRSFTRARCGGLKADGYAHHPYDFDNKPTYRFPGRDNVTLSTLGRLTRALDRLARNNGLETPGGRPLDLYLTEYGFFRSGKRRVPESRRAKWLVQGFQMAQRNPRVKEMLQYLIVQPSRRYAFFDTSIVSRRNRVSRTFKALQRWAAGAIRSGRVASSAVIAGGSGGGSGGGGGGSGGGGSGGGGGAPPYPDVLP